MNKSKVYILLDGDKIIRCEGGYTIGNIEDISKWVLIDEGEGDKYNLCQSHYFDGGLHDERGIPRWKYINGKCVLRSEEEMAADIKEPEETESTEDLILSILADQEERLCNLELFGSEV